MKLQTGRARIAAAITNPKQLRSIVEFGDDDCGLYLHVGFYNDYGTSLAVRGTRAELEEFVAKYVS